MSRVCSSHDIIQYCYKVCGITSGSGTTDSGGNTLYYKKKMIPKRIIPTLYKLSLTPSLFSLAALLIHLNITSK